MTTKRTEVFISSSDFKNNRAAYKKQGILSQGLWSVLEFQSGTGARYKSELLVATDQDPRKPIDPIQEVAPIPFILLIESPLDQTIQLGFKKDVTFKVKAEVVNTQESVKLSYQWYQVKGENLPEAIPGAIQSQYTKKNVTESASGDRYFVKVSGDDLPTVISSFATLTVIPKVVLNADAD